MPFHEIREVNFSSFFNTAQERRRRKELTRGDGKLRMSRVRRTASNQNSDKEVDFWA